jgi:predicted nucleic acid-binding protein
MIIYPDTCCYGRPFDDQAKAAIRAEAVAFLDAVKRCKREGDRIIGSLAVTFELDRINDAEKREEIKDFYFDTIDGNLPISARSRARADVLKAEGLGDLDSIHLAVAEEAGASFLLTTDADFIRICAKTKLSAVKVINPLLF